VRSMVLNLNSTVLGGKKGKTSPYPAVSYDADSFSICELWILSS
jgi:hypothetical protein